MTMVSVWTDKRVRELQSKTGNEKVHPKMIQAAEKAHRTNQDLQRKLVVNSAVHLLDRFVMGCTETIQKIAAREHIPVQRLETNHATEGSITKRRMKGAVSSTKRPTFTITVCFVCVPMANREDRLN